jgi:hypothetical protein
MIGVEAAQRDHATLEAHPLDETLGLALLSTVELTVVVLVEALQDLLAPGAVLVLLRRRRAIPLGSGRRRETSDEGEGENDSLHALPTRRRARS